MPSLFLLSLHHQTVSSVLAHVHTSEYLIHTTPPVRLTSMSDYMVYIHVGRVSRYLPYLFIQPLACQTLCIIC
ncbi:hypothetical protein F5B17DRAFT_400935, partial [Nemania serpens]